jgi:hypothetical protein
MCPELEDIDFACRVVWRCACGQYNIVDHASFKPFSTAFKCKGCKIRLEIVVSFNEPLSFEAQKDALQIEATPKTEPSTSRPDTEAVRKDYRDNYTEGNLSDSDCRELELY